jgi:hypothetical protein
MAKTYNVPLPEAAHRLEIPWAQAWRWVLTGKLDGEKRRGRWYVAEASIQKHLAPQNS